MWYRHALEYLHIGLVVFFFAGFFFRRGIGFYLHRVFVIGDFATHRILGTCPLTDLTKYLHKLEDPSYVPPELGCIQQVALSLFGIHLPEIVITLIAGFFCLLAVYDFSKLYRQRKQSTERTSPP